MPSSSVLAYSVRPWIHVTEIVEDVRGRSADSGIGYINTLPDMLDIVPKRDASSRVWSIRDGDFEFWQGSGWGRHLDVS